MRDAGTQSAAEPLFGQMPTAADLARDLRAARAPMRLVPKAKIAVDPLDQPPNADLLKAWGARACLQNKILPWRRVGGYVVVLVPHLDHFHEQKAALEEKYGPVKAAIAELPRMQRAIQRCANAQLAEKAETRTAAKDSCRDWDTQRACLWAFPCFALLAGAAFFAPHQVFFAFCLVATLAALIGSLLKLAAALAFIARRAGPPDPALPPSKQLPRISVLVPLFREERIADHLRKRLMQIDYPRDRLDIILVVERDDAITQATLARTPLPPFMRALPVPPGTCQTKPRALNYALDFANGEIIGIYDAEDAPEPDQLLTVARRFAVAPPDVVCLQGALDFYNSSSNWLARCFTVEYATWFRVVLPGLERLGLALPLGGTTLFFRRDALEKLGGWDAHNVTEDADLGIRLARRGWRTQMIPSTTFEEANARAWPWIRQRSRWIKGYALTYWVHMRRPIRLWRDLGTKQFFGFQVQFGVTLAGFLLAPFLWSFWLALAGFHHAFISEIGRGGVITVSLLFLTAEVLNISISALGTARAGHQNLLKWVPSLYFYYPLASLASLKAFWELFARPFYWDKTTHGIFQPHPRPN